jgi:hypothetical protein
MVYAVWWPSLHCLPSTRSTRTANSRCSSIRIPRRIECR